jgi:hypothetical protein
MITTEGENLCYDCIRLILINFIESLKDESDSTPLSNDRKMQYSHVISPREIAAWVLVMLLMILLISSVVINVILALRTYKRKPNYPSPDCTVALDNNPCYETSLNVKQTEAQEAVHVYETVKQHN